MFIISILFLPILNSYILINESITFIKYGIVGLISTLVHLSVIWVLINQTDMNIIYINSFAFIVAFIFSFFGNFYFTFKAKKIAITMIRFFLISLFAFFINTLLLISIMSIDLFTPFVSAVFSFLIIPIFHYFASRFWAFNTK